MTRHRSGDAGAASVAGAPITTAERAITMSEKIRHHVLFGMAWAFAAFVIIAALGAGSFVGLAALLGLSLGAAYVATRPTDGLTKL